MSILGLTIDYGTSLLSYGRNIYWANTSYQALTPSWMYSTPSIFAIIQMRLADMPTSTNLT